MRDYIPKHSRYRMPKDRYQQAKYAMKSYLRLQREFRALPPGGDINSPEAIRRFLLNAWLTAMDRAVAEIPVEYRKALLNNLWHGTPCPHIAAERTWSEWRCRLLYHVAQNLNIP